MKFIRFKDIPLNEKSGVYDGDLGKIREEEGVSCFDCIKINNIYKIIIPSLDTGPLFDLIIFIENYIDGKIPAYLIEAIKVGLGTYGEPVVKNIKIIKKLNFNELQIPEPKFKLDKTNKQFCEITENI